MELWEAKRKLINEAKRIVKQDKPVDTIFKELVQEFKTWDLNKMLVDAPKEVRKHNKILKTCFPDCSGTKIYDDVNFRGNYIKSCEECDSIKRKKYLQSKDKKGETNV